MAESLDELLLRGGLVTEDGLAAAHGDAARTKKRLEESLIDLGLIDERELAEWMAQVSRATLVDPIPEEAAALVRHHVTPAIARELQVVPLRLVDEQLFVVMANPLDDETIDVLQGVTGRTIRPVTGVRSEIERIVNRLYPNDFDAPDITILPASVSFDTVSSGEVALPSEEVAPFEFSSDTLIRRPPELDFLRESTTPAADEEFGTIVSRRQPDFGTLPPLPPAPKTLDEPLPADDDPTPSTNPVIGIERRLDQIVRMMKRLEKRVDELEALLHDHGQSLER